jgi:F0F1-type ATP synthase membrane subunit b/b'
MDQLTPFERALLAQFETLAHGSEASLKVSKAMESALRDYSAKVGARIQQIEARQSDLTAHLQDLDTALTEQTQQTKALVDAVNRLLAVQKR